MGPINDWVYMLTAIAGLTAITFICRASFFMLPQSVAIPARVEQALRFAPACALTAIVAPGIFTRDHEPYFSAHNNQMWALLIASLVFAKTRNMLVMMGVGMAVYTALRLWLA
jgi:branched-subunit amino acid transport protein